MVRVLAPSAKRKVRAGIEAIRDDPTIGTKLAAEFAGLRLLHVGQLRVAYRGISRREIAAVGSSAALSLSRAGRGVPRQMADAHRRSNFPRLGAE